MSLEKFFSPQSVAIVGASQKKGKVGYEILTSMVKGGYEGKIFPVNHKATEIGGLKCYPDLKSIGEAPELVLIIVPAKFVPEVMHQCVKVGAKSVVIITAGFKEVGEDGLRLEQQVMQIAQQGGIRFVGPNCLGVMDTASKLNASFGGDLPVLGGLGICLSLGPCWLRFWIWPMLAILDLAVW